MSRLRSLSFVVLMAAGLTGCGTSAPSKLDPAGNSQAAVTSEENAPDTESSESVAASVDSALADVSGRVTMNGEVPPRRKLSITKDVETCGAVDTVADIEGVDGGVKNVVVEIRGVKGDDFQYKEPADGYQIRQKDCQFTPSLVIVPLGKEIHVYNDDPVGHNVNTGAWNQTQPPGSKPIVKPVENKSPTKIVCNIHSWMEGWIYSVQNPHYAVTTPSGEFKIQGVPPGKYRVNIWHPSLGRKTTRLMLEAGEVATLDHEYELK